MPNVRTHRTGSNPRHNRILTRAAAAAAAVVGLAAAAASSSSYAADVHWNVVDGKWEVPENWAPLPGDPPPAPAVPGATDRAVIDFATPGATVRVDSDVADVLTLKVTAGNTLSIEPGGVVTALIGNSSPIVNDPLQAVRIGDGGIGTVTVNDGTLQNLVTSLSNNQSSDIYVGVAAGGVGSLTQSGTLAQVAARDMRVGSETGVGTYTINDGTLTTNFTIVGRTGGTGTLNVNGGTLNLNKTTNAHLDVGDRANSTGTLNLTGGAINATGEMNLGFGATSGASLGTGTATINHTGGTLTSGYFIAVGRAGSNTGTNRGSGTYTLGADAASTAAIDVNAVFVPAAGAIPSGLMAVGLNGGSGTMTMNGGSIATDLGFHVGYNTEGNVNNRSHGTMDLNAGTLTVGGVFAVGHAAATGSMTMDGGTINVTGMSGVGYDDRTNDARATLTIGQLDQTAGTINAAGGFTVATGSGTGTYNLTGTAALNVGPATSADLLVGGTDAGVTVAHTMLGTLTINDTAAVTVAGQLRMGQTGGDAIVTVNGGTLNVTGNSLVGQSGTTVATVVNPGVGTLNINGGSASFAGNLTAGDTGNSNGTINVTAGTLGVTGALVAGRNSTTGAVITQSGGTINAGSVGVRTGTGTLGDFNLTGGALNVTGAVTNNSTFDASGSGVATVGGGIGGTGSMTVADTAAVNAASVRQASLTMTGGTVKIADTGNGTAAGVSRLTSYALSGDARFDLRDNKLVTDKAIGTFDGTAYTGVHGDVQRAYNFGAWDQPGLMTSEDNAGQNAGPLSGTTTIGVATAEQVLFVGPTDTALFAGQTVTGATTIAMYTYAGDVNFDGLVDGADYGTLDNWIQFPGTSGYANGDVNYDGVIDGADYGVLDNTIQLQGAPFLGVFDAFADGSSGAIAGVTAVPEPSACGLALLGAAAVLGRRRRRGT